MKSPYFSPDYIVARTRFRELVSRGGGALTALELAVRGPQGETLSIDVGWFGPENPRRVVLHSSGLHGVEGFVGSAIQLLLLESIPRLPDDGAIVLVHILNPYGMAWMRRFNENNVDLNRNFLAPNEKYEGAPEGLPRLNSFLNPASPPSPDFFYLKALRLILRQGMPSLKQAVAGGQYEFPKGLFFGGERLQEGPEKYVEFLTARLCAAEQVVAIDVHTGLGKHGEDALPVEPRRYGALRQIFGARVLSSEPDGSPAYCIRGGIDSMVPRVLGKAQAYCLCQEFGTYSPIKVLHALREENRWHHFGDGTVGHATKQKLKGAFCPQNSAWQAAVLTRGTELFQQAAGFLFGE